MLNQEIRDSIKQATSKLNELGADFEDTIPNLEDTLNIEIVRELLREQNVDSSDEHVAYVWSKCDGNPWNAFIMHKLLAMKKSM